MFKSMFFTTLFDPGCVPILVLPLDWNHFGMFSYCHVSSINQYFKVTIVTVLLNTSRSPKHLPFVLGDKFILVISPQI
jgi:hypothetical protein